MASPEYDDKPSDPRPEMSEDSASVVMLRDIANQMRLSNHYLSKSQATKVDYLKPPRTAMEIAAYDRRYRDHLSLAARLLPHKRDELLGEISGG